MDGGDKLMYDFSVIKSLRKKRGLSGEELAEKAGLTRATVAKIEAGDGNPTVSTLESLAMALGLAGSQLLQLAEVGRLERPQITQVRRAHYQGRCYRLGELEFFLLKSKAGHTLAFDPAWHENTAEVILVFSGRLRLVLAGDVQELSPGDSVGFKAMQEHRLEILADSEFLIIHPSR